MSVHSEQNSLQTQDHIRIYMYIFIIECKIEINNIILNVSNVIFKIQMIYSFVLDVDGSSLAQ